jgi:hypothetical protein
MCGCARAHNGQLLMLLCSNSATFFARGKLEKQVISSRQNTQKFWESETEGFSHLTEHSDAVDGNGDVVRHGLVGIAQVALVDDGEAEWQMATRHIPHLAVQRVDAVVLVVGGNLVRGCFPAETVNKSADEGDRRVRSVGSIEAH